MHGAKGPQVQPTSLPQRWVITESTREWKSSGAVEIATWPTGLFVVRDF